MKGKIGLITIYHVPNYGSVLQAFATQCIIDKLGYECEMLNYKYPNEYHFKLDPAREKVSLKHRISYLFGLTSGNRMAKKLFCFKKNNFHFSKKYNNLDELRNGNWLEYKAIVVGSDQVWKAEFTLGDSAFLLSFVPDEIKKISYASSFASKSLSSDYRSKYKKYLSRFDYISIRENNGMNVIKDLGILKDVQVVLDPTLLLTQKDWLNLVPRSKFHHEKGYILLYLLSYAFEPRPYIFEVVQFFQQKYDYDVIALAGYQKMSFNCPIEMIDKTDSDISEFIDIFSNASLVVTSSFHGTAFALNFNKPLVSIVPDNSEDDRQSSLLRVLSLEQCITKVNTPFTEINPYYKIDDMNLKMQSLRDMSTVWLDYALSHS